MTFEEFKDGAVKALAPFSVLAKEHEFEEFLAYDHICYKSDSHGTFEEVRRMLEPNSYYMYGSWIGGRLICIFKLKEPIGIDKEEFSYIELHDKKPNADIKQGFYHLEVYPKGLSYDAALEKLQAFGLKFESDPTPHHPIYEMMLPSGFGIRLERESIMSKIKNEEII
jgi:hypothetical protein